MLQYIICSFVELRRKRVESLEEVTNVVELKWSERLIYFPGVKRSHVERSSPSYEILCRS